MKNRLKRIMAAALAMLFVWGAMPQGLLANPQAPVNNLWLNHQTAPGSQNYTFTLNWRRPDPIDTSSIPALTPPGNYPTSPHNPQGPAGWNDHRATRYEIVRRNAALANIPANWVILETLHPMPVENPSFQYTNNSLPFATRMQNGRFYAFRIDASHDHHYRLWVDTPPPGHWGTRLQRMSATGTMEVHFLTDLDVSASGFGNEMTVEWSRPLLGGVDPHDSYRIFFAPGGASVSNIFAQSFIDVPVGHSDLEIIDGGARYRFTFEAANLVGGAMYAVAVEPMKGSASRRTTPTLADMFLTQRGITLHYTMNEYRTNNAFVQPRFQYTPIGIDLLQLSWDIPQTATSVTLWSRPYSIDAPFNVVGSITSTPPITPESATQTINYWLTQRPDVITEFLLEVRLEDGTTLELELIYDPSITPFTPTRPNILEIGHTPDDTVPPEPPITLDIIWQAFHRLPYTQMDWQDTANLWFDGELALYFDPNIVYEIFISDSLETLEALSTVTVTPEAMAQANVRLRPSDLPLPPRFQHGPDNIWAHGFSFNYYFDSNRELRPIEANTVYYVRINARREGPDGRPVSTGQVSLPAYGSHFIPGRAELRPLTVPVPPLRVVDEDLESITIAWERRWHEVFDTRPGSPTHFEWVTQVDGRNIYAMTWEHIDGLMLAGTIPRMPIREQVLEDHLGFEIYYRPLIELRDYLPPDGDFEGFVTGLHGNPAVWRQIDPDEYDGTLTHTIENLERNTSYGIFFRPFNPRMTSQHERNVWWPSFLTGTTTDEMPGIEIQPTTPILRPHSEGDTWLRFDLRPYSNPPLRYEFMISEFPDFDTAWELAAVPEETFQEGGFNWRRFAATQLFPETTYYIWARAIGNYLDGSDRPSLWSNPIAMRTLPIMIPDPPRGLGIASGNDVHVINVENDRDHRPVEPDAMIITWLPHPGDGNLPIEMQGGAMGTEILGSPQIGHAYLVRFPGLVANRPYYVRARTIYSIHREGISGPVTDVRFNYIVQFSENPDFIDATTVFVLPDAYQIAPGLHTRMAMSDWTQTFIFHTARDDGEFDSDIIDDLFPLPMRDFEIIYTAATQTLFFRFRSTDIDQDGHRDNLVDQRFISRLIQQRVFDYAIDMTHYNHYPVRNRIVELPYTIIQAFEERQITFSVTAGDTTYSLAPGFAATPQNIGFNVNSRLRIYINDLLAEEAPELPAGQNYLVAPQNIAINVVPAGAHTNERVDLTLLAAPLNVSQSINRAAMLDANVGSFAMNPDDVAWRRMDTSFNEVAGTLNFSTQRPQDFTAIGIGIPLTVGEASPIVRDALYFVNSVVAFEDMEWFMEDNPINAWQINRIIYALARRQPTVAINTDLTSQQMSSLSNGGMLVPGADTVTREAAISALVRLFESRTGSRVVGYPTLESSFFADMEAVSAARQQSMLKAEFLGFIDGPTVNPHGNFTMGEAMVIFEIILRN